ncbi:tyrosine-type recombinase/integrase [Trichocoleus sp. FACHB-90]|uniref:tyrosine-type recombinase/integrase n=1 Tax=Cyanophyceae TaxID=3028117 RepID=UPI00168442AE|nr:tyrosine-type recombinase/integrase [Trichocoleus sp. FACHB-90]MBD1929493.1 tyrosine-type recombinase/integrase [Trichocoleus sp. FACHB-90]
MRAKPKAPDCSAPDEGVEDQELLWMWLHAKSDRTRTVYREEAQKFLAWVNKPLKAATLVDLYRYVDSRGDLAPATLARIVNTLKSLFRFAHEAGYCPVNVALKLKPPKVRNRLAERLLTQQDVVRLIENATSDRNKVLLLLAYTTGLRVSEICGLKWRDLVAKEGGGQLVVRGKGGKTRYLWLPTPVWMAVERLRGTASASDPVFTSRKEGGHLSRSMVMRIVRAAALKAGIDAPVSPHWLRHAHASHALERGAPLHLVQHTLGHSQIQSVAVYLHVQPMDSSVRFLIGVVSDEQINQVEGNKVTEAIAPITVEVLPSSLIPKLPESRSDQDIEVSSAVVE